MPKRKSGISGASEVFEGAVVTKLIQEVKKRPCLWNSDDENYKDRFHISTAWKEISQILDVQVDTIRIKWKNLRDFFYKIIKKRDIKDIDDYIGRWRHFKSLWFLYKPNEMLQIDDDSCEENTNTSTDIVKCEPTDLYEVELSTDEVDPIADKKVRTHIDEDFDLMFLKSLTPFLKQLEPIRKLVVRSKIQEILLNEIAAQTSSTKNFY